MTESDSHPRAWSQFSTSEELRESYARRARRYEILFPFWIVLGVAFGSLWLLTSQSPTIWPFLFLIVWGLLGTKIHSVGVRLTLTPEEAERRFEDLQSQERLREEYELPTIAAFGAPELEREYFAYAYPFDSTITTKVNDDEDLLTILRAKGAPASAYVMGTYADQCMLDLDDALEWIKGEAGVVICIPARLAVATRQGEKCRYVLEK